MKDDYLHTFTIVIFPHISVSKATCPQKQDLKIFTARIDFRMVICVFDYLRHISISKNVSEHITIHMIYLYVYILKK